MTGLTAIEREGRYDDRGFDVERIRADFPILGLQVNGKPLVFLDNAASAQMPQPVMQRFGVPATARASFAFYNTLKEIDVLVAAILRAQKVFA